MRDRTKGAAALGRWRTTAIDSLEGPQELQKFNHTVEEKTNACKLSSDTTYTPGGGGELGSASKSSLLCATKA